MTRGWAVLAVVLSSLIEALDQQGSRVTGDSDCAIISQNIPA